VEAKLGKLALSDNDIFELLRKLDYQFEMKGSAASVIVPGYRTDMSCLEDVMEDIARLIGYENLERQPLRSVESISSIRDLRPLYSVVDQVIESFRGLGFSEAIQMSFTNREVAEKIGYSKEAWVELANPIHAERSVLRKNILPDLIACAKRNWEHGEDEVLLVEGGPVFSRAPGSNYENSPVNERQSVAVVWLPRPFDKKKLWADKTTDEFFRFKGICEAVWEGFKNPKIPGDGIEENPQLFHPNRQFSVANALAGELHPQWAKVLDLPARCFVGEWAVSIKASKILPNYVRPQIYPPVDLDASFLVDAGIHVKEITAASAKAKGVEGLEWMRVYDIFESKDLPSGKKSVTFAMRYRSGERTLTLDEAKKSHEGLIKHLVGVFGANRIALR
jgi:phenylalanyl-tRNA synthetase beta chain